MDYRDKLIESFATKECNRLTKRVITRLKKMTESLMSGDDTPLKNTWEEICVQVQHEQSFFWDIYLLTIEQNIEAEIMDVDPLLKEAIWLQTDEGRDWSLSENNKGEPPCFDGDIVNYILRDFILSEAIGWTNKRIVKYLEYYHAY